MVEKKKPLNPKMMVNRNPEKVSPRETMPKKIGPRASKENRNPKATPVPLVPKKVQNRGLEVKPKPSGPIKKTSTTKTPIFQMPKKTINKKTTPMPKAKNKKAPAPMPTTKSGDINPFKMTPQQKLDYLRNPQRYSKG